MRTAELTITIVLNHTSHFVSPPRMASAYFSSRSNLFGASRGCQSPDVGRPPCGASVSDARRARDLLAVFEGVLPCPTDSRPTEFATSSASPSRDFPWLAPPIQALSFRASFRLPIIAWCVVHARAERAVWAGDVLARGQAWDVSGQAHSAPPC